ncbi:hypothetical protein KPB2_5502 [Klebsiella pneumoniae Kb677]|nr:hypothetical protein KPB2_5502 [Klebsiella pneumoniae Kb677]
MVSRVDGRRKRSRSSSKASGLPAPRKTGLPNVRMHAGENVPL